MALRVFYIDDEPDLCESFSDIFSTDKIEIFTFTDPKLAIAAAEKNPPHLIFIDYRLPAITGDKVAQAMDPSIPKFLVTGDISVVSNYEFVKIYAKPYEYKCIRELLDEYVQRQGATS